MTPVKTYGTRLEADLASILLRADGIMSAVVGVGLAMEGCPIARAGRPSRSRARDSGRSVERAANLAPLETLVPASASGTACDP
jgi:hypothetical protein